MLKCARDNDDNVIGCANENPILDTKGYVVELEDGDQENLPPTPFLRACMLSVALTGTSMSCLTLLLTST